MMRQLEVGIALIHQGEKYILQLRGEDPAIGAAGLIGGFGGKLEPEEAADAAVCRELSEETSLAPLIHELEHLGVFEVISDHRHEDVKVKATFFRLPIEEALEVEAKEGSVVCMTHEEVLSNLHRLTPATRAYFETLIP